MSDIDGNSPENLRIIASNPSTECAAEGCSDTPRQAIGDTTRKKSSAAEVSSATLLPAAGTTLALTGVVLRIVSLTCTNAGQKVWLEASFENNTKKGRVICERKRGGRLTRRLSTRSGDGSRKFRNQSHMGSCDDRRVLDSTESTASWQVSPMPVLHL